MTNSFTVLPGAAVPVTAVFEDAAGVQRPVTTLPIAKDPGAKLVVAPVGTPTLTDPAFHWAANCPSGVVPGTTGEIDISAGAGPGGLPVITGKITYTVLAPVPPPTPQPTQVVVTSPERKDWARWGNLPGLSAHEQNRFLPSDPVSDQSPGRL